MVYRACLQYRKSVWGGKLEGLAVFLRRFPLPSISRNGYGQLAVAGPGGNWIGILAKGKIPMILL